MTLSWFVNYSHKDIKSSEILVLISLPYAPVSSEVSHNYFIPSLKTELALLTIA